MKYLFVLTLLTVVSLDASAQSRIERPVQSPADRIVQCRLGGQSVPILLRNPFKIKVVNGVDSGTARVADYVEFKTMESIYAIEDQKYPTEIFPKDTPIYAVVTTRKHRHFPFVGGRLEITLEPLVTWDGTEIQMAIARHPTLPLTEVENRALSERERWAEIRNREKNTNKPCRVERKNCVAARINAEVAPVVTAIAAASAGAVGAISKDDQTRFIAATAFFSIAKDLGNLLNGTDAKIAPNEILDLYIDRGSSFCKLPERPKSKPEPTKVVIVKSSN
jgi:hypothetical protein